MNDRTRNAAARAKVTCVKFADTYAQRKKKISNTVTCVVSRIRDKTSRHDNECSLDMNERVQRSSGPVVQSYCGKRGARRDVLQSMRGGHQQQPS